MTVVFDALEDVAKPALDPDRLWCSACGGEGAVLEDTDHYIARMHCWSCKAERAPQEPGRKRASPDDLIGADDSIHEVRELDAGVPPIAYRDDSRIGQDKCAEICAEIGMELMANNHLDAFTVGHMDEQWRAMKRRLFYKGRAEYERAQAVLCMVAEGRNDFSPRGGV